MRRLFVLLMLVSLPTAAMDISAISSPVKDPRYTAAFSRGIEACMIQSGMKQYLQALNNKLSASATKRANELMMHIPVRPQVVQVSAGIAYSVLVRRELRGEVKNPIFVNMTNSITITQNSVMLGIKIIF